MDRKSPYRHPVSGHFRSGKFIEKYERGKGKKPGNNSRVIRTIGKSSTAYSVTLSGDGESETYTGSGSPVSSLKDAVSRIQKPFVPTRAVLRLVT